MWNTFKSSRNGFVSGRLGYVVCVYRLLTISKCVLTFARYFRAVWVYVAQKVSYRKQVTRQHSPTSNNIRIHVGSRGESRRSLTWSLAPRLESWELGKPCKTLPPSIDYFAKFGCCTAYVLPRGLKYGPKD